MRSLVSNTPKQWLDKDHRTSEIPNLKGMIDQWMRELRVKGVQGYVEPYDDDDMHTAFGAVNLQFQQDHPEHRALKSQIRPGGHASLDAPPSASPACPCARVACVYTSSSAAANHGTDPCSDACVRCQRRTPSSRVRAII